MEPRQKPDMINDRESIVNLIDKMGCQRGIELGVGNGSFSEHILINSPISQLYSVDKWDGEREHDLAEYHRVMIKLHHHGNRSVVLKMTFKEAFDLLPDDFFDFIYIDGFAFTGNRGEIFSWWQKLKKGGIYSGHDYSQEKYPLVKEAVDEFVKRYNINNLTITHDNPSSWIIIK